MSRDDVTQLAHRLRELSEATPEREAYLEQLAQLVREGRYVVDAEALADKLIERALSSRRDPQP